MSNAIWAARLYDPLIHTSWMAEAFSKIAKAVAYGGAIFAIGLAAGLCGPFAFALAAVGGMTFNSIAQSTSLGDMIDEACDDAGNYLFPPEKMGKIITGSLDTRTNRRPSARAAGTRTETPLPEPEPQPAQPKPSFVDVMGQALYGFTPMGMAEGLVQQGVSIFQRANELGEGGPIVAMPDAGTAPAEEDKIYCERHSVDLLTYMVDSVFDFFTGNDLAGEMAESTLYLAQGSKEVFINLHPASRSNDKSDCEAYINEDYKINDISPDVRIGGDTLTVRPIRSGKNRLVELAGLVTEAVILIWSIGRIARGPCKTNPVEIATGAKAQEGTEDLDFQLPSCLPIVWQRQYYSSQARSNGLFGAGWTVAYENTLKRIPHPDQEGDLWLYYTEDGRELELGVLEIGKRIIVSDEGISVYPLPVGVTLIENNDTGIIQVFETDPIHSDTSRLARLSDSNGNHLNLNYDEQGRLERISDDAQ